MAITASVLAELQVTANAVWEDDLKSGRIYGTDADTAKEIKMRQTAKVNQLIGTKDRDEPDVKVKYIDPTGIDSTTAVAVTCTPSGTELSTAEKSYSLDITREAEIFQVDGDVVWRNNIFDPDQIIVRGLLRQRQQLDNYLNQQVITKLIAAGGTNALPDNYFGDSNWDVTAASTYVASASWDENLFANFGVMKKFNKMGNPFLLHGSNYLVLDKIYEFNKLNDNERDQAAKMRMFDNVFDPISFNTASVNNLTLMVDPTAVAFASKWYFPETSAQETGVNRGTVRGAKELKADKYGFAFPSTIPGHFYDVTATRTCDATGALEDFPWTFQMRLKAGLFTKPEIVTGDTGVLEIYKGNRPT